MNSPHPQGSQLTSQLWYSSQFSSPALLASVTGCLGPYPSLALYYLFDLFKKCFLLEYS